MWERSRAVKRAHEEDTGEEYGGPVVRAKWTRMGGDGDKVWFHRSIAGTVQAARSGEGDEAEEEKAFLVPSVAAFPHGMSAATAGPSLAEAKKEEFNKSSSTFTTTSPAPGPVSAPPRVAAEQGAVPDNVERVGTLSNTWRA